jgi:hypothetical protein
MDYIVFSYVHEKNEKLGKIVESWTYGLKGEEEAITIAH